VDVRFQSLIPDEGHDVLDRTKIITDGFGEVLVAHPGHRAEPHQRHRSVGRQQDRLR